MSTAPLFLGHDLGTHGNKAVLVDAAGRVYGTARRPLALRHPGPDRAEQEPEEWWRAVCACTREVLAQAGAQPGDVHGIAFAGQMLALVCLDDALAPTRPALSWMDARAGAEARALTRRMGGAWVVRRIAGATPSAKDILPKLAWIRSHEPEVWRRTATVTDATGYLVARAAGRRSLDVTGAGATGVLDGRTRRFSPLLARLVSLPTERLPEPAECAKPAGELTAEAARDLGLRPGLPVAAGLADIPAAAVGAGATRPGDAHVCLGTSSWFCVTLDRPIHAPRAGMVSTAAAAPGTWLMIGENETAGACAAWLAREVWPDDGTDPDDILAQVDALAATSPPGARGLLFAPWMFGERTPVPDAAIRAAFLGLSLEHRRADVVRAVHDGIALNIAWTRKEALHAGAAHHDVRLVGGGTAGTTLVQAVADALGETVALVDHPQYAGAVGAALVAAVAAGALPDVASIHDIVRPSRTIAPSPSATARYRELLAILMEARPALARISARLAPLRDEPAP